MSLMRNKNIISGMRNFVIGDIHGHSDALQQCFDRSGFDFDSDSLICLGDVCDRGPDVKGCIDQLLDIKNLVYVLGNHDKWFLEWAVDGEEDIWWRHSQGGEETIKSYNGEVPVSHIKLLQNAPMYYISQNRLFVHAGIVPGVDMDKQTEDTLLWDRKLVFDAHAIKNDTTKRLTNGFDEIFVGHTPVSSKMFGSEVPLCLNGIWMMDTGAGWGDKLTIMDVDTGEFWQSDNTGN